MSFTTIDFTFTNSRVLNSHNSLPIPDDFISPKDNLGSDITISFTLANKIGFFSWVAWVGDFR